MSELLADTTAARKRRKAIALALAVITLLLVVAAIMWWRSLPEDVSTPQANNNSPVEMSAADILAAYKEDPTLAQLGNRPILITANVKAAPLVPGRIILLDTPDPLQSLGAEINRQDVDKLSGLRGGTEVSLRCEEVDRGLQAPVLKSCSLL